MQPMWKASGKRFSGIRWWNAQSHTCGNAGECRSSLHYDCFDGLLLVIRGVKTFHFSSSATRCCAACGASASANHSRLDASELEAFPGPTPGDTAVRLTAGPGDAVFIPAAGGTSSILEGAVGEGAVRAARAAREARAARRRGRRGKREGARTRRRDIGHQLVVAHFRPRMARQRRRGTPVGSSAVGGDGA